MLFLPAGMGALYGDREAAPNGEGPAEAGAAPDKGLALALWLPLREVDASAASSRLALAELSPRLLRLSPESTRAFLQPHGMPHVLLWGLGLLQRLRPLRGVQPARAVVNAINAMWDLQNCGCISTQPPASQSCWVDAALLLGQRLHCCQLGAGHVALLLVTVKLPVQLWQVCFLLHLVSLSAVC